MEPGDVIAGRFRLVRRAGAGGMGEVFRAEDLSTGEPVAIKVLHGGRGGAFSAFADRFMQEAELLAELDHPGIVRHVAHALGADGELWLAMEWLEGEDLALRMDRGPLSIDATLTLGERVAGALAQPHARGVVHRDIKPANLFLPGGRVENVTLLDFGIARLGSGLAVATRVGVLLGTPGYMAPEQARGDRQIDPRVDVFALGCVLFEAVTGQPAFVGESAMALLAKVLFEEAPRASELVTGMPAELDDLLARMLEKSADARPRDGAEVAREIAALRARGGAILGHRVSKSAPPPSLGAGEQQLLSVVLAASAANTQANAPTMAAEDSVTTADQLRVVVSEHGGRLESLVGGSLAAVLTGVGVATDLAARAARCALAMHAIVPSMPMALATGRGVFTDRFPVGEALDRAARLLRGAAAEGEERGDAMHPLRLDDVTAGLLPGRFEVGGDEAGLFLQGEREAVGQGRTLLGRATSCVGRDRELALLQGTFAGAIEEPAARVVLVTAGPGAGKSRLAGELLDRLARGRDHVTVLSSAGDPLSAGSPFSMIAPALRRAAGVHDGEPEATRRHKLRARLQRHVRDADLERVTAFLGELIGIHGDDDPEGSARPAAVQLRAARRDAMLMGDQMRRAFEDFLEAETAAGPLLFVLEDLHWGDLPSVSFLGSALRNLPDRPWMVLALARPEVHDVFPGLWSPRELQEIRLRPLSKKGSVELARQVLGEGADAATIDRLVELSTGNAFYLEELLRSAATGQGDELPATVLAMAEARIGALEPDARRTLRAASVFGQVAWRGGIDALVGGATGLADLDARLDDLVASEVLERRDDVRFPGEREYAFRHSLVREAAYATLTERDRALGHRLAAAWLERSGEREPMPLAEHFERGGEPARAVAWFHRAAEQALAGDDFATTVGRVERAVACGASGETLGILRVIEAEAHNWRGAFEAAAERATEALRLLPRGTPAWCSAAGEAAFAFARLGVHAGLVDLLVELRALGDEHRALPHHIAVWARTTSHLFGASERVEAEALLARIEAASDDLDALEPAVLGWIHHARSWRAVYRDDPAGSVRWEERAAESFERAGDLRHACEMRMGLGVAYREIGAQAEAERALREALATASRLGLSTVRASALHNLGPTLAQRGALAEARAVEEEAIAIFRDTRDRRLEVGSRNYLARILTLLGDHAGAASEGRAALAMGDSGPEVHTVAFATLARSDIALGRPADALENAGRAMALFKSMGSLEEGESFVRLVWIEALFASGRRSEARDAAMDARMAVLRRAATIHEPAWQQSFLALPENVRILALATSWDPR
jgi:tetratricopeptide (TPR) repeat protein